MRVQIFRLVALLAVAAGGVGAVLPVVPTVPFLLLAAWAGSKGWPELEQRLLAHPRAGPPIVRWREHGAIPVGAKLAASAMMLASLLTLWATTGHVLGVGVLAFALAALATWLWTRPNA